MTKEVIEVKNIRKSFGDKKNSVEVLKEINFKITQGEFVSLIGASGSGKSTLLYLIGGLDQPTSGNILIEGADINQLKDKTKADMRRREIGFIFQFYNLVPNLTVAENIMLPVILDGRSRKEYEGRLNEILDIVGLAEKYRAYPRELSGGQQQKVAIARAVIMEPKIILADEATGNLDSKSSEEIMELFTRINKDKNITILQVTHSKEIVKYTSRVINLKDGMIID